jgi:hypothetical protein
MVNHFLKERIMDSITDKIIVIPEKYRCPICRRDYDSRENAQACLDKQVPKLLPIGTVFSMGDFYSGITFCIASNEKAIDRHYYEPSLWACRNNGCGDSLGNDHCGGNFSNVQPPIQTLPTFKRMIDYLKSVNIKPIIFKEN